VEEIGVSSGTSTAKVSPARLLGRSVVVWCVLAFAETIHGVLRGLLVTPALGDQRARQLGVLVGAVIILAIAWLLIGWVGARATSQLFAVGGVWLVLMLAFEVGLGRGLGFSWERIWSDYDPTRGGLMILGMAVLFLSPLLAARTRAWRNTHEAQ
jgi:hypothetical protein